MYELFVELIAHIFAVTYEGSLTLSHRNFTAALYDPTSREFKTAEGDTCNLVCQFLTL